MEYTATNILVRLAFLGLLVFSFCGPSNADLAACAKTPADIFFALDTSTSIGKLNFGREKSFVINFVRDMDIGPQDVQVSVGTFADNARRYFALHTHLDEDELVAAIQTIPYQYGQTHTNLAFQLADQYVFTDESGDRPGATDIMFVLTDGMSQNHSATVQGAQKLKNAGVKIYTIGIGNQTNRGELLDIASDPNHLFMVDSFQDLSSLHNLVQNTYCEGYSRTNTPTVTTVTSTSTATQKVTPIQTSIPPTSPPSSPDISSTNTPTSSSTVRPTKTTISSTLKSTIGSTASMTSTTQTTSKSSISSTISSSTTKSIPAKPTTTTITTPTTTLTTHTDTTTSTPAPPTSIATPPPVPEGPCEDKITNCAGYGDYVCTNYRKWAIQNCARFCLFCHDAGTRPPPSTTFNVPTTTTTTTTTQPTTTTTTTTLTTRVYTVCEDKVDQCSSYGPDICFKYTTWAAVQCPKFCVFCEPSTTTTTTTTTTTPPPPTTPRVCADQVPNCAELGPAMCIENKEYAMNTCPVFCLFCTPTETTLGVIAPQTTPRQITTNPSVIIIGRRRLDRLHGRRQKNL